MVGIRIAPSLLATDLSKLEDVIKYSSEADVFHIDVMDGKFVPQTTEFLDPKITKKIRNLTKAKLDVHLMVEEPWKYANEFKSAGADMISFHIEAINNQEEFNRTIGLIQSKYVDVGVALNPDTDPGILMDYCKNDLSNVDFVLLMSVVPGKCGQGYIKSVTDKIKSLNKTIKESGHDTFIEVDGGIKVENAFEAINAGAELIVSGSGVYGCEPDQYNARIKKMKEVILIGSDHGGFELKEKIKNYLTCFEIACYDVGTYTKESCEFPIYARRVAKAIGAGEYDRGVLCCGTGIGMCIAANRYPNVRASICYDEFTAKMTREHNDSNILCLGERSLGDKAIDILETWLDTKFSGDERHVRRLKLMESLIK